MEFSTRAMKRLLKKETDKRVSKGSAEELRKELIEMGNDVSEEARRIAESSGRKTVRSEDIREAVNNLD